MSLNEYSSARVSLWDSLMFGRLAMGFADVRAGTRVLMLVLVQDMLKDFAVNNLESSQPVGGSDWQCRLSYNAVVSEACSPIPRPAFCGAHS